MKQFLPKVSVCIPTFNRAEMLREVIISVLTQSFQDFELIISDNASQDQTQEVMASMKDDRIRYIRNETNIGMIQNFNQCLARARGSYITIFHDDDLMLPDNLRLKVRALDQNSGVGLVHSKFDFIDEHGVLLKSNTNFGKPVSQDRLEPGRKFLIKTLMSGNTVNAPSVMIRRECYERLGGFDERLTLTADAEYWMRLSLYCDILFLARPLVKSRRHAGADNTKYFSIVNRSIRMNPLGIEERLKANSIVLERYESVFGKCEDLKRRVRASIESATANFVVNDHLQRRDKRGAKRYLIQVCRRSPEILASKVVMVLLVKTLLNEQAIRILRQLASRFSSGDQQQSREAKAVAKIVGCAKRHCGEE